MISERYFLFGSQSVMMHACSSCSWQLVASSCLLVTVWSGSDGTFTTVRGGSNGVRSSSNSSSGGVYIAQQQNSAHNAHARSSRPPDSGTYRHSSSYGPRGPAPKTGLVFLYDFVICVMMVMWHVVLIGWYNWILITFLLSRAIRKSRGQILKNHSTL